MRKHRRKGKRTTRQVNTPYRPTTEQLASDLGMGGTSTSGPNESVPAPPTAATLITQAQLQYERTISDLSQRLQATQDELARVLNVGYAGGQLKTLTEDLHTAIEEMRSAIRLLRG